MFCSGGPFGLHRCNDPKHALWSSRKHHTPPLSFLSSWSIGDQADSVCFSVNCRERALNATCCYNNSLITAEESAAGLITAIYWLHPEPYIMSGRPMNLIEKLISNAVCSEGSSTDVAVGDIVLLKVEWVLASELSWTGMDQSESTLGKQDVKLCLLRFLI